MKFPLAQLTASMSTSSATLASSLTVAGGPGSENLYHPEGFGPLPTLHIESRVFNF